MRTGSRAEARERGFVVVGSLETREGGKDSCPCLVEWGRGPGPRLSDAQHARLGQIRAHLGPSACSRKLKFNVVPRFRHLRNPGRVSFVPHLFPSSMLDSAMSALGTTAGAPCHP